MSWIRYGGETKERGREVRLSFFTELSNISMQLLSLSVWLLPVWESKINLSRWPCSANEGWNKRSVNGCQCCVLWFVRVGQMRRQWTEFQDGRAQHHAMQFTSSSISSSWGDKGRGEKQVKEKRRGGGSEWTSPVSKLGHQFKKELSSYLKGNRQHQTK